MATRGQQRVVSDMDEHSKLKVRGDVSRGGNTYIRCCQRHHRRHQTITLLQADARAVVKEALEAMGSKDDKVIAGYIKVRG